MAHFQVLVGQYEEALKLYQNDYESLIGKSIALQQLGRFDEASQAIEQAISMESTRFEGYFRRGQLNFIQGKIDVANQDLEYSLKLNQNHKDSQVWLQKCKNELKNTKFQPIVDEKIQQAQRTEVVNVTGRLLYKWYQTDSKVGIEIHHPLPNKDLLKCHFDTKKLAVEFPLGKDGKFELNIDLFGEVTVENCRTKVGLQVIEVLLEKKVKNSNWIRLESKDNEQALQPDAAYPTSSTKKKNWDKIDKEITEDMEKHKEEYGEDPLNSLFKQIYANGDEETRRAMIKSMSTSGGTVLSTNWKEVAEKQYDGKDRPAPPQGQELKKM